MKSLSRPLGFSYQSKALAEISADILILPLFEKEKFSDEIKKFDESANSPVKRALDLKDFIGLKNSTMLLYSSGKVKRILLAGLGKRDKISAESARASLSAAFFAVKNISCAKAAIRFPDSDFFSSENAGQAVVETAILSLYEFTRYKKTDEKKKAHLKEILILADRKNLRAIKIGGAAGEKIAQAVCLARDLANEPANIMTPAILAKEAIEAAKQNKIKYKVLEEKDMRRLKMGALLAVAQGSSEPAKFIILEYNNKSKIQDARYKMPTIVLVGKGLTFDSGGISIKPSQSMDEMKYDMAGGATVIGAMQAAAQLKLPINLIGLIPSTENLPSGTAQRPGDIVRAMNGKTIEVLNTDAEGRMILADSLVYAKKYNPDAVVDFATLTGAIVVAIGEHASGLFTNNEKMKKSLEQAGDATGERVWNMPLYSEYLDQIKGDLADLKNVGGKDGGASTAAKFLEQFADFPWAHLDIAGTAWTTKPKPCQPKGATGVGVRLIVEFLKRFKK